MPKVTVVGAGNVGATCAHSLLRNNLADVVLIDIDEGLAKGKALDLSQAGSVEGFTHRIIGTADYAETADSDLVVITAGLPRKPGMSRQELLEANAKIVSDVVRRALFASPEARILVVTNPMDHMAYLAYRVSELPAERVVGMGGALDTARFKYFIASEVHCDLKAVEAMVIGAHSDSMVPLLSLARANGVPLRELVTEEVANRIALRTREGGAEIVSYLKHGSAFYAPGAAAADMAKAILLDEKRIVPASVLGNGAYGINGIFIGLPVRLGSRGAEQVVELPIDDLERKALDKSAKEIEAGVSAIERAL